MVNPSRIKAVLLGFTVLALIEIPAARAFDWLENVQWSTVVNNGDYMPAANCNPQAPGTNCRKFNSYNQPSVNARGTVVIRARSRGGQGLGQPVHGVYIRDMAAKGPVKKVLDRNTLVPQPNNRGTVFVEPPSFPRIDMNKETIATRGNHQPVWKVLNENGEIIEQLGTTGIYTNPFGNLMTGASKLGSVAEFSFFEVPEAPGIAFDVFPGAPAVTNGSTIVFKGNYTVNGIGKTGVYFRRLGESDDEDDDGPSPVVLLANNTHTLIPGTNKLFGSTAPPSAAGNKAVFTGLDNEQNPAAGGIYLTTLTPYKLNRQPNLDTLIAIGSQVPGETSGSKFNQLGEGLSFDGRFVAFWGAWGSEKKTVKLYCPDEGNQARIDFCKSTDSGSSQDAQGWYQEKTVPVNQGIFVIDTKTDKTYAVARTNNAFTGFLFWNFSGRAPGVGAGEEGEEDGELARWRSNAFMAVSGVGSSYQIAFKASTFDANRQPTLADGIYFRKGSAQSTIYALVETGMIGTGLDPEALDETTQQPLSVTELGIERDGFRNGNLAINVSMGSEETGWAGVYLAKIKE